MEPVYSATRQDLPRPSRLAGSASTTVRIAKICSGAVSQQPLTMLTGTCSVNSLISRNGTSGVSPKPIFDIGLGKPAFGLQLTKESGAARLLLNGAVSLPYRWAASTRFARTTKPSFHR